MRRDQQCVRRGLGITGWRSSEALALTYMYSRNFFLRDRHGVNGLRSEDFT